MRVREPGLRLREMGLTRILLCDMRHFLGVARLGERRAGQSLLRGWRNERFPSLMPGQAGGNGAPQEAMSVPFSMKAWVDEADQGVARLKAGVSRSHRGYACKIQRLYGRICTTGNTICPGVALKSTSVSPTDVTHCAKLAVPKINAADS